MKVVGAQWHDRRMVTVEDVRGLALTLPRSYEAVIADRIKFRVGRIVYLAFSRDESVMGFAFPKQERAALIAAEPEKFRMPRVSDQRYNWVDCWTAAIDEQEMRELVIDAWRMVVPKFLHDHPNTSTSDS
ncbi:MmcQ/YjbR family DNA-binding protein [Nocardia sp. NBC_00403]|uniref:MmcQ/YjbR family DNA-binding protein n=1 Tax=Nocardia sp. NBC_00403 TaxID=2975990 RepID=UPI002E1F36D7